MKTKKQILKNHDIKSNLSAIINLILLLIFIVAIPVYIWVFHRDFIRDIDSIEEVVALLDANKTAAILIYLGLQIMQIIVSVLPGQVFQVAAGYYFGFFMGLVYSLIGAAIGTTITYFVAKWLGSNAIEVLFGKEKIDKIVKMLNSSRAYNVVFLLYLIPGIPKDLVGYAAGISSINFRILLVLSIIGRTFGMSGSLLFGYLYAQKEYTLMYIVAAVAVIIFLICIIYRKKISKWMESFYNKIG